MLVNRRTFIVKKPYFEEALALLVELRQLARLVDSNAVMRVYASEIDPFDTIAYEAEHESLTAYERVLAEFEANPTVVARLPEWFTRWQAITEPGGMNEIWRLPSSAWSDHRRQAINRMLRLFVSRSIDSILILERWLGMNGLAQPLCPPPITRIAPRSVLSPSASEWSKVSD